MQFYDVLMEFDRKIIGFKFRTDFDGDVFEGNQLIVILTLINLRVLENNIRFYVFELLHNYCCCCERTQKLLLLFLWKNHKPKFPFNVYYS